MRKSPKNLQGLRPLEPAGAKSPPFSRSLRSAPARAGLVSATDADGFATLRWCGQLATPSPLALTKRNILLLIRGSGVLVARLDATLGAIRGIGEGGRLMRRMGTRWGQGGGDRGYFGGCKTNSALFWQQIIHKWAEKSAACPYFVPILSLSLSPFCPHQKWLS